MKNFSIYNAYIYFMANYSNSVLYIGVTNNLERRILEHKSGEIKGFTSKYKVNKLVYYEGYSNINEAIDREKNLKRWKREWKNRLVNELNPEWKDLFEG